MIGEILFAVQAECNALLQAEAEPGLSGGTVLFKSRFLTKGLPSAAMTLILIDMPEGPDTSQWLGGVTKVDWMFLLNSYSYFPDNTFDDNTDYSANLLNVIDRIRQHFSVPVWLTQGMTDIETNYGFKFTLSTVQAAEEIPRDGLTMGWKLQFDSMAIDTATNFMPVTGSLQHLQNNGNAIVKTTTKRRPITYRSMLQNTNVPICAGTYVQSILMDLKDGSPVVSIGTTQYGQELFNESLVNSFFVCTAQLFFETDGFLYFSVAGGTIKAEINLIVGVFAQ